MVGAWLLCLPWTEQMEDAHIGQNLCKAQQKAVLGGHVEPGWKCGKPLVIPDQDPRSHAAKEKAFSESYIKQILV